MEGFVQARIHNHALCNGFVNYWGIGVELAPKICDAYGYADFMDCGATISAQKDEFIKSRPSFDDFKNLNFPKIEEPWSMLFAAPRSMGQNCADSMPIERMHRFSTRAGRTPQNSILPLIEQLAESNGIDSVHKISEAVSEVLGTVDSALARVDAATGDQTNLSGGAKALKIALESPLLFYEPVSTAWFMNTGLLTIPKTLFVGDGNTIEFKEDGCMDIENFWGHYGIHTVLDAESEYVWTNHDPSNQDPLGDALQSPALAQAMNFLSFQFFQMFLPDRTVDPQVDCAPAIAAMMDKDKTNTDPFQNYAAAGLDIHAMPGKWGYRNDG